VGFQGQVLEGVIFFRLDLLIATNLFYTHGRKILFCKGSIAMSRDSLFPKSFKKSMRRLCKFTDNELHARDYQRRLQCEPLSLVTRLRKYFKSQKTSSRMQMHLCPRVETLEMRAMLSVIPATLPVDARGQAVETVDVAAVSQANTTAQSNNLAMTMTAAAQHVGTSPFDPPEASDSVFVVDQAPGLDTGCTFRSGGPLVFSVQVDRFFGDISKLRQNGLINEYIELKMPAYDVDFDTDVTGLGIQQERDIVYFNGHQVIETYLTGSDNEWKMNTFQIPIEWVNFPSDPGPGGQLVPADNTIQIDIDTANTEEDWCTSIDWATMTIDAPSPVFFVHGILSNGSGWNSQWVSGVEGLGIPAATIDLGGPLGIVLDSIQNNSQKIAGKISELQERWGVDQLNIVAHSKGGIDSRDYIENSDAIGRLIQIGTPNEGSPLANYIQSGIGSAIGVVPLVLLDTFLTPAGLQLTTGYMKLYNLTHGYNPDTEYVALAGNYHATLFGDPIGLLLNTIVPGNDDSIVPVSSVHSLGYTIDLTYSSTSPNSQAKHTSQTSSSDIYNELIGYLEEPLDSSASSSSQVTQQTRMAAVASTTEQTTNEETQNTATITDSVAAGETVTHTLVLDGTGPALVSLYFSTGDMDFSLISPSGAVIDPTTIVGNANIQFAADKTVPGMKFEVYQLTDPEAGTWTVKITGNSVENSSGREVFMVTGWFPTALILMDANLDRSFYTSSEPMVITADLENNGNPITGSNVQAKIILPDNSFTVIPLLDDGNGADAVAGDGIYSGTFSDDTQGGIYQIIVDAVGENPAFSREAMLITSAASSTSTLSGTFSDVANDTNSDGLYENLVINVGVNIDAAGYYRILGELTDSTGNPIGEAEYAGDLTPGQQTASLSFNGTDIFNHGVDGPYTLSSVRLTQDVDGTMVPVEELQNAYQTAAYDYIQFQHPSILVLKVDSDQGIDDNANGLFDRLEVNLSINLLHSGYYQWSGRLVDINGKEIGFAGNSGQLDAGSDIITLDFTGSTIGHNGVDGPYFVTDLLIYSGSDSAVIIDRFATNVYLASQFEGFECPVVQSFLLQNGAVQRANINTFQVQFSKAVNVPDMIADGSIVSAVSIVNLGENGSATPGQPIVLTANQFSYDENTNTLTWTFDPSDANQYLPPGQYQVRLDGTKFIDSSGIHLRGGLGTDESIDLLEFQAAQTVQVNGGDIQVDGYSVPMLADWNSDGLSDLIVGEKTVAGTGKIRVYLNDGTASNPQFNGYFYAHSASGDLEFPASGCLGVFPRVYDWNSDGKKDLVVGLADGTVQVLLNENTDADPIFGSPSNVQVGDPGNKVDIDVGDRATLDIIDPNKDGYFILVVGALDGKIRYYYNETNTGMPDFRSETVLNQGSGDLIVSSGRSSPVVCDLNNDQRLDLLTGNTQGQLIFYANSGAYDSVPAFIEGELLQAGGSEIDLSGDARSRPFVGDFNADGLPDLLVGAADGLVRLYKGEWMPSPSGGKNNNSGAIDGTYALMFNVITPLYVTINQATTQADPTNSEFIHFTVIFNEAVTDFASGDVTLSGTAGATTTIVTPVGTDGTTFDVAVSGMTTDGTVIASINGGVAHDAAGNLNAASTSADNIVTYIFPATTINGTVGSDLFEFSPIATPGPWQSYWNLSAWQLKLNGNPVDLPEDSQYVVLNGLGGTDQVKITGTSASDTFQWWTDHVEFQYGAFQLQTANCEIFSLNGGGGSDSALIHDTTGNDLFQAGPGWAILNGDSLPFSNVENFNFISSAGGNDTAIFFDSPGNDILSAGPNLVEFTMPGYKNTTQNVENVQVYATPGGNDTAYFTGSSGDDSFIASRIGADLIGDGFNNSAWNFRHVGVQGNGGYDSADLYAPSASDIFTALPTVAFLSGTGYDRQVKNFQLVVGHGQDLGTAYFFDSPTGADTFAADCQSRLATLSGTGYANRAEGFSNVQAYATPGGSDTATFQDSAADDKFIGSWYGAAMIRTGVMTGGGYDYSAWNFVNVQTQAGTGNDKAYLFAAPTGPSTFVAHPTEATLSGTGYLHHVMGFEVVEAYATPGTSSTATFYDSTGDENYIASSMGADMTGSGFNNSAWNFSNVTATSSGGHDAAYLYDSAGNDQLEADSTHTSLFGATFNNRVNNFEKVTAHSSGGVDKATLDNAFIESGQTNRPTSGPGAQYSKVLWLMDFDELWTTQKPNNATPTAHAIDKIMSAYWL